MSHSLESSEILEWIWAAASRKEEPAYRRGLNVGDD